MNKSIWAVIIVLILIGGFFLINNKSDKANESMMAELAPAEVLEEEKMMEEDQAMSKEAGAMTEGGQLEKTAGETKMEKEVKAGSYEVYAEQKLTKAETGKVVLFFRASWCPTCRILDTNIKANLENIPVELTILDVNYDDSWELKKKYGVTYQHTLVQVAASGELIKKWTGSSSLAALVGEVN